MTALKNGNHLRMAVTRCKKCVRGTTSMLRVQIHVWWQVYLYIQTNTTNKNTVYTLRSILHISADMTATIR